MPDRVVTATGSDGTTATLSFTGSTGPDQFFGVTSSSTFGTFNGSQTVANVCTGAPTGTNDFMTGVAGSNTAAYTLAFSAPVKDPILQLFNIDFRRFGFAGGVTPTVPSGLSLFAAGSVAGDTDSSTFDNAGADPTRGDANGAAYGSPQVIGTFGSVQWTEPNVPGPRPRRTGTTSGCRR